MSLSPTWNLWQKSRFVRRTALRWFDEQNAISATRGGGAALRWSDEQNAISATGWGEPRAGEKPQAEGRAAGFWLEGAR